MHDQDNTNATGTGTGTVAQTVPKTITIFKILSGVYHCHFQNFSDRGGPLLPYNS